LRYPKMRNWKILNIFSMPNFFRISILKWGIESIKDSVTINAPSRYPKMRNWKITPLNHSTSVFACILKWGIERFRVLYRCNQLLGQYPKMRNWKSLSLNFAHLTTGRYPKMRNWKTLC